MSDHDHPITPHPIGSGDTAIVVTDRDALRGAAGDMAHRDDLARDVAREWAENRRHPTPEWEPVGAGLAVLLDRLAAAYGETP